MEIDIRRDVDIPELTDVVIQKLLLAAEGVVKIPADFEWSIAFVDDATISGLNQEYRHKEGPTDVLSFLYDDTHGEIIISVDRVRAQATEFGNTMEEEGAWMVVHGILHVMGWDHERSPQEHDEQRALEVTILDVCGLKCAR